MSGSTEGESNEQGKDRADETVDADLACDRLRAALREGEGTTLIGHYRLKREIAAGGMGVVYEAVQENPRRVVAVKVMRTSGLGSRNWLRRFQAEAQALARLHHPCIAQIFEAGEYSTPAGSVPFFAMEYIPGAKPLPEHATRAGLNLRQRLELFVGVCRAVHHAHTRGIIHRDLKPANILVGADGQAKVIDFGVSRAADAESAPADLQTDMRSLVGTLMYMSPEQCEGDPNAIDPRSDVYTLGIVLFELLTGRLPYEPARGMAEIARRICHEPPLRPSSVNAELAGDAESVLLKALEKDPANRYQSAGALADDLERLARGEPVSARAHLLSHVMARLYDLGADRQVFAWLLATAVASVLVYLLAGQVVYRWTDLNKWYTRTMVTTFLPAEASKPLEAVRVITLSDQTDFASLVGIPGTEGVSRGEVVSYRKLHGALLRKLADSGVRVVVFDVAFRAVSPFDADFVSGIKDSGLHVVVGQKVWDSPAELRNVISPNLAPYVRRGGMTGQFSGEEPWFVDLVVQKRGAEPIPSLSLLAVAAFQHPDMELSLRLNELAGAVELRYFKTDPASGGRIWPSRMSQVVLTVVQWVNETSPVTSIENGDLVGSYLVRVPEPDAMAQSVVDYADVFKADPQTLRSWFDGKVALIADVQLGHDKVLPYPGLKSPVPVCYSHAAAIDAVLAGRAVRVGWDALLRYAATAVGALLSAVTIRVGRGKRAIVLASCLLLIGLAAVWLYVKLDYLVQPFVPALGLLAGFLLHGLIGRRRHRRPSWR